LNANEPSELKLLKRIIRFQLKIHENTNISYNYIAWHSGLPSYLWRLWKDELGRRGITWQRFLRILSLHTKDIVDWALYDRLGWAELIKRITMSIESYSRGAPSG